MVLVSKAVETALELYMVFEEIGVAFNKAARKLDFVN